MKKVLSGNELTLFFEGELNSYNCEAVEKEIEALVKGETFSRLILDFASLRYISSAGLRIILKLKQKYGQVCVVEASLEVYDVLSMTGFVNIMPVSKALKRIDITNAKVVGDGFFSTVYRIDKDTIIKVFNRVSDTDQIERELRLAKQAFVLGIPTAISFDIVRVGEKLGVRFEMLDCQSLQEAFIGYPDRYDEFVKKYADLLKRINATDCMDPSLPSAKAHWLAKVDALKPYLEPRQFAKLRSLFEGLEDSMNFVHGDCHFKNIMVQGDDFLLIDMDTLSRGEAIFELAAIRAPYVAFEEDDPGNSERFLHVSTDFAKKLYNDIVDLYLGKNDPAAKDKIALVCYAHMMWWTLLNQKENTKRFEGCKSRLLPLLEKYDDLKL